MDINIITPSTHGKAPLDTCLWFLCGNCYDGQWRHQLIEALKGVPADESVSLVNPRYWGYSPAFTSAWERNMIQASKVFIAMLPNVMGRVTMFELGYWCGLNQNNPNATTVVIEGEADPDLVTVVGSYVGNMRGNVFVLKTPSQIVNIIEALLNVK